MAGNLQEIRGRGLASQTRHTNDVHRGGVGADIHSTRNVADVLGAIGEVVDAGSGQRCLLAVSVVGDAGRQGKVDDGHRVVAHHRFVGEDRRDLRQQRLE